MDFTDLNAACPNDPYPLQDIDRDIDESLGYQTLSFMDAYSEYNLLGVNMDYEWSIGGE